MKIKKQRVFLILFILFALLISAGCTKEDQEETKNLFDTPTPIPKKEEAAPEEEEEQKPEPTPVPVMFSYAAEYGDEYKFVDELLQNAGIINTRDKVDFHTDSVGDNIFGDPNVVPGGDDPFGDIIGWGSAVVQPPDGISVPPLYEVWPPGYDNPRLNSWTVYPDNWEPPQENVWITTFIVVNGIIPRAHETLTGTIASVSTTDDNPDNDFVPSVSWDFFQYTDRWDMITYLPGSGWGYMVMGDNFQHLPTSGFGVIHGNTVAWNIPVNEVILDYYGWRGTIHWINLMYDPASSSADTIHSNPQLPPEPVPSSARVTMFDPRQNDINTLPSDYKLCHPSLCTQNNGRDQGMDLAWCECDGCTNTEGCDCHLFRHNTLMNYGPDDGTVWEYAMESGVKYPEEMYFRYNCFCVKKAE